MAKPNVARSHAVIKAEIYLAQARALGFIPQVRYGCTGIQHLIMDFPGEPAECLLKQDDENQKVFDGPDAAEIKAAACALLEENHV